MSNYNYFNVICKNGDRFDIHCEKLTMYNSGNIEFYEICNDVEVTINVKDILIITQINPFDAGMEFTCYNDLVRAFTEHDIEFEVL